MTLHAISLDQTAATVSVILGICALVGVVVAHYKWARPKWRAFKGQVVTGRDTLIGRPAIIDSITKKEIAPAVPSLGERMEVEQAKTNQSLRDIVTLLESQHAQDRRLEQHEDLLVAHDGRIRSLEEAAVERIVTKAESASAWRAVEAVATNGAASDDDPELD